MLALLFAVTAFPLLLTELSLSRQRQPGSRVLALHALLGGLALLAGAVGLHATATTRAGAGIVMVTVVVVHALALSAWWQLREFRRIRPPGP